MTENFEDKIINIDRKKEISVCPTCGYKDGFHVSFHTPDNAKESEVIPICPNCHSRFRMGWRVTLSED